MPRTNKFAQSSAGLAEKLGVSIPSDNVTRELVKELDEHPDVKIVVEEPEHDNHEKILYAEPDQIDSMFIPYCDEKLRLQLLTGERYDRLKESIEKNGFYEPVICTPRDGKLMIIAGHNRTELAKRLKLRLPYIVKTNMTEDEMNEMCMDTNLLNRQLSDYKPSQLAYALKIKNEAEAQNGNRLDITLFADMGKGDESYNLSRMQISRYIKLNDLIKPIMDMLDSEKISMRLGYQIAFLPSGAQEVVYEYIDEIRNEKPIEKLRAEIRQLNDYSDDQITEYVKTRLPELCIRTKQKHVTDYRNLKAYIPSHVKPSEVESYIIKALEAYNNRSL